MCQLFTSISQGIGVSASAQSCLTLCDPMHCSTPGLPVHCQPPRVYSNSRPLSQWCHSTISSSVIPFSFCPQSFPELESFQMSQLFASGGQSIGVSTSTSILPMNTQDWSPLEWTGWISLQSKGLSRVFSNTTVQKHQFYCAQSNREEVLSSESNHLILCHPLFLPPLIFPSIRVFSNESALCIRWPKYWSFSFNISPSNEHPGLISFRMDWLGLLES